MTTYNIQLHPIFKKELTAFDKEFRAYLTASIQYAELQEPYRALSSEDEIAWLKSFLLQSLKRASMSVVEESVGGIEESTCDKKESTWCNCGEVNERNNIRTHALATARDIIGTNEQ